MKEEERLARERVKKQIEQDKKSAEMERQYGGASFTGAQRLDHTEEKYENVIVII